MLHTTRPSQTRTKISVTLSPGCSSESHQAEASSPPPLASFPVSCCALEEHPRTSVWEGLSEAGQILAEAEAVKGMPLTLAELRALMEAHLDAYDPRWNFGRRGISDAWMSGWQHACALYAQQLARLCDPEPLHGIGLISRQRLSLSEGTPQPQPRTAVRFRRTIIQVQNPDDFFQGIWEGQLAALDEQKEWTVIASACTDEPLRPLSSARLFDDLLDLFYEAGNHGLDFITGYMLGLSEGLLCGRTTPPVRVQAFSRGPTCTQVEPRE